MRNRDREREPIKVVDRRSFTPTGDRRVSDREKGTDRPQGASETVKGPGFEMKRGTAGRPENAYQEVEFNSFILSLASTAFIHLGEMEDPVTHKMEVNLPAARQIIDIIDMLHGKTKGNLEAKEEDFIKGILYELKLRFAQKAPAS